MAKGFIRRKKKDGQTKKYNNKKVVYNDIKFDSQKEFERYIYLKSLEDDGKIFNLSIHTKFELIPKVEHPEIVQLKTKTKTKMVCDQLPITYSCDFSYDTYDGKFVVEDIKPSPKLPLPKEFEIKRKLLFWKSGIKIKVIYNAKDPVF